MYGLCFGLENERIWVYIVKKSDGNVDVICVKNVEGTGVMVILCRPKLWVTFVKAEGCLVVKLKESLWFEMSFEIGLLMVLNYIFFYYWNIENFNVTSLDFIQLSIIFPERKKNQSNFLFFQKILPIWIKTRANIIKCLFSLNDNIKIIYAISTPCTTTLIQFTHVDVWFTTDFARDLHRFVAMMPRQTFPKVQARSNYESNFRCLMASPRISPSHQLF